MNWSRLPGLIALILLGAIIAPNTSETPDDSAAWMRLIRSSCQT